MSPEHQRMNSEKHPTYGSDVSLYSVLIFKTMSVMDFEVSGQRFFTAF